MLNISVLGGTGALVIISNVSGKGGGGVEKGIVRVDDAEIGVVCVGGMGVSVSSCGQVSIAPHIGHTSKSL